VEEEPDATRPDVLSINTLLLFANWRFPRRRELESRNEKKAAKTLAINTGAFIVCCLVCRGVIT
jgi:hypothetical protein